jgi:hypothetical protein
VEARQELVPGSLASPDSEEDLETFHVTRFYPILLRTVFINHTLFSDANHDYLNSLTYEQLRCVWALML